MMLRDFVLKCPSRSFYYNAMEQGVPVYSYITDVKEPSWPITWVLGTHHGVGTFHFIEKHFPEMFHVVRNAVGF